jgi:asparagine synthase (glutamine-hydrolysing)
MCGLSGFIDTKGICDIKILKAMTSTLSHRGPDAEGFFFEQDKKSSIGLGHRRLSILDISKNGNQPLYFNNNVIIYNGEIYNFLEIKEELKKSNYIFDSNSDTEVILKAYDKWGIDCINKFIGMFVIIIYDKKKQKVILVRDRVGIKPLYYYHNDGLFMFASELKSFHKNPSFKKDIDPKALNLFFKYGYILEPFAIFKSTKKLRSGHYIEYDLINNKIHETKYWDVANNYNKARLDISYEDASLEMERLLKSSFQYRTVSDVPVGVFLSGGYDSSIVSAILQKNSSKKIKTFTIGFNEKNINEANHAKDIANFLKTEHYEHYCSKNDALEIFPQLPNIYDEPFGDPSSIPTVLLSNFARKYVTVSLSADGGDEIFAGYSKYLTVTKYRKAFNGNETLKKIVGFFLDKIKFENFIFFKNIKNFNSKYNFIKALINNKNPIELMKILSYIFSDDEIEKLLKYKSENAIITNYENNIIDFKYNDDLNALLAVDFKTYLCDNILVKVDRATMSSSLEGREPFLDHRIIEFCSLLPSNFKTKDNVTKLLLKDIAHKYIPKNFLNRPKMGFVPPLFQWLKNDFSEFMDFFFNKDFLHKQNILDKEYVLSLYKDFINGKNENLGKLWLVMIFFNWYKKWCL